MKILAIDDQQLVLLPLEKKLTELGHEVTTTTDAYEGIGIYNRTNPDLVIVDINMPDMSGLEFIKYLRNEIGSSTSIVVLSCNNDNNVILDAYKLGVTDYVKKPISYNDLAERMSRLNIYFQTN